MSVSPSSRKRKVGESNPIQPRYRGDWLATRFLSPFDCHSYSLSRRRSRISRSSFSLNRPLAFPIHRNDVHIVQRTFRRRFPAVLRRRFIVDRMGVEPIAPTLQGSVAPNGMPARFSRGPFGNRTRSSSLPRTCAARTPTDLFQVIPGRIELPFSWVSSRRLSHWTTGS